MPLSKFHPDQLHHRIVSLGEAWADADAAAGLLEETRKTVLAECISRTTGKSMAEREQVALGDPAYSQHLAAMIEARRVANRAKVNYDAAKVWIDLVRSQEATKRTEMGMR